MRVAIIGPAHPYKGGIAQHTTELAHRLTDAGHEVDLISWRTQYPFFYPGQQFVTEPELPLHSGTKRALSWRSPAGWVLWGRKLRSYDRIILVWWVPTFQGPAYLGLMRGLGQNHPPVTVVCHNVLPHKGRAGDHQLTRAVLSRCDQVIVHSPAQAALAAEFTSKPVRTLELPMHPLPAIKTPSPRRLKHSLLFFGFIRPYKGLDVLLKALAKVPDVHLTVAGEIWGDEQLYADLIKDLGLSDRVTLAYGYVSDNELAQRIAAADAVVLPYKAGTATINVRRAFMYGTPVIATKAGSHTTQVQNNVDGLLCEPDDVEALAAAIKHFYEPGVAARLRQGVPKISIDEPWRAYVDAIISG